MVGGPPSSARGARLRAGRRVREAIPIDWATLNHRVIAEFRANSGQVGGRFAGLPIALLHSVGARTGGARINPVIYLQYQGDLAIFASKSGAATDPEWLHNVRAHPDVAVEIGRDLVAVRATVTSGAERARIWERQKAAMPVFADYEAATQREIPVVVLRPVDDPPAIWTQARAAEDLERARTFRPPGSGR